MNAEKTVSAIYKEHENKKPGFCAHRNGVEDMGMYHKNHLVGPGFKRMAKRQTSKGMRRAAKKSCQEHFEDSITLTRKSHNLHGIDAFKFS